MSKASVPALLAIALAGCAVILVATSTFGIGISAESETYIVAARNFAEGRGLLVATSAGELAPLTQHPPLYATLLGLCGRAGIDPVEAARWIGAFSLGALALLAGMTVAAFSKRLWLPPVAAALVICSFPMLNLHLTALSEPLFLIGVLAGFLLLLRRLETGGLLPLLASALACGAALLARYAGVAAIAAGVLALVLYDRSARRWAAVLTFAGVSCLPMALWAFEGVLHTGNPVQREFALHPFSGSDAAAGLQTLSTWILPGSVAAPLRLAAMAAILLAFAALVRRVGLSIPARLFLWFAALHLLTIVTAKSFFDAAIPLDDRILSPLYIPAILAGILTVDRAARTMGRRMILIAPAALVLVAVIGFNLAREIPCLARVHQSGREYTGVGWRESTLAGWLQSVSPGTPVYSNIDSAVRFLRGGAILGLPPKADIRSHRPNARYPSDLQRFRAQLADANGIVVYFTNAPVPDAFLPTLPELIDQLHLRVVARGDTWIALRA